MIIQGGGLDPLSPPLWIRTWPDNRDLHRIEQNSCLGGTKINQGCVVYLRNNSALAVNCYVIMDVWMAVVKKIKSRVRMQPIIALYFESETVLKFYHLKAR